MELLIIFLFALREDGQEQVVHAGDREDGDVDQQGERGDDEHDCAELWRDRLIVGQVFAVAIARDGIGVGARGWIGVATEREAPSARMRGAAGARDRERDGQQASRASRSAVLQALARCSCGTGQESAAPETCSLAHGVLSFLRGPRVLIPGALTHQGAAFLLER